MYAATCSVVGLSTLYWGVNGLTAALGATNFILYTLVYTPMKRISILNTWIGSVGKDEQDLRRSASLNEVVRVFSCLSVFFIAV